MAIDMITLTMAKKYTEETVIGGGAIRGKNCTVKSIVNDSANNRTVVTFEWTLDNGTVQTQEAYIPNGTDGKSAYELAVSLGYSGTLNEWLETLRGNEGKSAYDVALENGFTGTQEEWLLSLKGDKGDNGEQGETGDDGKSAYDIWIEAGNAGTEEDFLNSLKADVEQGLTEAQVNTFIEEKLRDINIGSSGTSSSSGGGLSAEQKKLLDIYKWSITEQNYDINSSEFASLAPTLNEVPLYEIDLNQFLNDNRSQDGSTGILNPFYIAENLGYAQEFSGTKFIDLTEFDALKVVAYFCLPGGSNKICSWTTDVRVVSEENNQPMFQMYLNAGIQETISLKDIMTNGQDWVRTHSYDSIPIMFMALGMMAGDLENQDYKNKYIISFNNLDYRKYNEIYENVLDTGIKYIIYGLKKGTSNGSGSGSGSSSTGAGGNSNVVIVENLRDVTEPIENTLYLIRKEGQKVKNRYVLQNRQNATVDTNENITKEMLDNFSSRDDIRVELFFSDGVEVKYLYPTVSIIDTNTYRIYDGHENIDIRFENNSSLKVINPRPQGSVSSLVGTVLQLQEIRFLVGEPFTSYEGYFYTETDGFTCVMPTYMYKDSDVLNQDYTSGKGVCSESMVRELIGNIEYYTIPTKIRQYLNDSNTMSIDYDRIDEIFEEVFTD